MSQLTIRGVNNDLQQLLKREAARRNQSINRYVLSLLQHAAGISSAAPVEQAEFHDLDHLAGTWTEQESAEFEEQLVAQRSIDEDLWR